MILAKRKEDAFEYYDKYGIMPKPEFKKGMCFECYVELDIEKRNRRLKNEKR